MFTVYILYSRKFNQIYIGFTSDLPNHFLSHNELATKGHIIMYRPWVIGHAEEYQTKSEAIKRAYFLKSGQGRKLARRNVLQKFGSSDG